MGLIASTNLRKPPEPPVENVADHKAWEDTVKVLDEKVVEAAQNLKDAFDSCADYAFKAAGFVHPKPSPDHGAQFDYTRLTADELRIFIPLFRKCLVNRATRQDSEQGAKLATSRARASRSNTIGRTVTTIYYRDWRLIWCAER
jgi:hypothetical protein